MRYQGKWEHRTLVQCLIEKKSKVESELNWVRANVSPRLKASKSESEVKIEVKRSSRARVMGITGI